MRKSFLLLFTFLLATAVRAQEVPRFQADVSGGYSVQDLNWSIAGNSSGANPNVYSELKWKNVGGPALGASIKWNIVSRFMLMSAYRRSRFTSGRVTDNDYSGDNRTDMVYDHTFDADKGAGTDLNAALGYNLFGNGSFMVMPYAGYSLHKTGLRLLDRSGSFADLNSTYNAKWSGPLVGINTMLRPSGRLSAAADIAYTQANYHADADWNLIQTFRHPISYMHTAKGYGLNAQVTIAYLLTKTIALHVGASLFTWQTGKGVDELFLSSGGSEKTQLNGVDNKGFSVTGGLAVSL